MFNNKVAAIGKQERREQEVNGGGKKHGGAWQKRNDKREGRKSRGGEADGRKEGEQEQVRELLSKAERTEGGTSPFTCTKGWGRNGAPEGRS